jgi:hypothetical protein
MAQSLLDFLCAVSPCTPGHHHILTTRGRDNLSRTELIQNCGDIVAACRLIADRNGQTKYYSSKENALRYQVDTDDINDEGVVFTDFKNDHDPEWWAVVKLFFAPPLSPAMVLVIQKELNRVPIVVVQ